MCFNKGEGPTIMGLQQLEITGKQQAFLTLHQMGHSFAEGALAFPQVPPRHQASER